MRVVTDDANDVEYTSTQLIIVGSVFDSIATLAVIARLYARRIKRVSYGADDLMVVLVLVYYLKSSTTKGTSVNCRS